MATNVLVSEAFSERCPELDRDRVYALLETLERASDQLVCMHIASWSPWFRAGAA